jgi:hypothetical protein
MLAVVPFDAHVLTVLIASPGDTKEERDAAERALHAWNGDRAERERVVVLPRRWETNAVPRLGSGGGQGVINEQLVDKADVLIALFDSRLGMATPAAVSGTAEEIQRAHSAGKPVHVWFSEEELPRDSDLDQLRALRDFKTALQPLGLLGSYSSPDDLAYKVRQALESDLEYLQLGAVQQRSSKPGAILRARYESDREPYTDGRGRVSYRSRRERIVVTNVGSQLATDVAVELRPLGDLPSPQLVNAEMRPTIIPNSDFPWPLIVAMGTADVVEVVMRWSEDGEERFETQHIALS